MKLNKREKTLIILMILYFILCFVMAWYFDDYFMVLMIPAVSFCLLYPILLLYLLYGIWKKRHRWFVLLLYLLLSCCLVLFPMDIVKCKLYYQKHEDTLNEVMQKLHQKSNQAESLPTYVTIDGLTEDVLVTENAFYLVIAMDKMLLADSHQWLVYSSNGQLDATFQDWFQITETHEIEKSVYFVKGSRRASSYN